MCNLGPDGWKLGRIIALDYREDHWPIGKDAPYEPSNVTIDKVELIHPQGTLDLNSALATITITENMFSPSITCRVEVLDASEKIAELSVLDKESSKNTNIKINIGKEFIFQNLIIKVLKCYNSQFDYEPEVTAYMQVKD